MIYREINLQIETYRKRQKIAERDTDALWQTLSDAHYDCRAYTGNLEP